MNFPLKFHRAGALGGEAQSLQPSRHLQRFLRKKISFRIRERRNIDGSDILKSHFAGITVARQLAGSKAAKDGGGVLPETGAPRHGGAQVPYVASAFLNTTTVHAALTMAKAASRNYWATVPSPAMSLCSRIHRTPRRDSAAPARRGFSCAFK